ncbi:hypothetical protein HYPSUDRAFT_38437 [Hypholoma sublateritium FD-334 SS-4]|uniref:Uncharacterized protein n=1 Tax=Hypholoma sublateritium (strain FD-334 SS-4) TaxID=945553 RepID=A0A0D2P1K0_HYPSF|nr:hypothetical protein HYPSUDRAFT_38437 [Hypholoma sublateritium FD-334 SS-4]
MAPSHGARARHGLTSLDLNKPSRQHIRLHAHSIRAPGPYVPRHAQARAHSAADTVFAASAASRAPGPRLRAADAPQQRYTARSFRTRTNLDALRRPRAYLPQAGPAHGAHIHSIRSRAPLG